MNEGKEQHKERVIKRKPLQQLDRGCRLRRKLQANTSKPGSISNLFDKFYLNDSAP